MQRKGGREGGREEVKKPSSLSCTVSPVLRLTFGRKLMVISLCLVVALPFRRASCSACFLFRLCSPESQSESSLLESNSGRMFNV